MSSTTYEYKFRFPIRVYYEDTDLSGIVYHANYLRFMERGRTEALRSQGIDQTRLAREDRFLVVRSITVEFKAPAKIDDELVIVTEPISTSGVRGFLKQSVWRDDTLLCEAQIMVLCMRGNGRPARMPESMAALFPPD